MAYNELLEKLLSPNAWAYTVTVFLVPRLLWELIKLVYRRASKTARRRAREQALSDEKHAEILANDPVGLILHAHHVTRESLLGAQATASMFGIIILAILIGGMSRSGAIVSVGLSIASCFLMHRAIRHVHAFTHNLKILTRANIQRITTTPST